MLIQNEYTWQCDGCKKTEKVIAQDSNCYPAGWRELTGVGGTFSLCDECKKDNEKVLAIVNREK